jgi:hypothetical protein
MNHEKIEYKMVSWNLCSNVLLDAVTYIIWVLLIPFKSQTNLFYLTYNPSSSMVEDVLEFIAEKVLHFEMGWKGPQLMPT